MLHREVLRHFGKLPSRVQKKTYEFIRKFELDSTQAGLHLEPVGSARDPKVRSARVGDDYRAIVIAPEKGDTFLLMYVNHHDQAYQWAKNKQFEAHGALGTLQVFDPDQVNQAAGVETPGYDLSEFEVPYPLDGLDDDELFLAGVPRALIPAVRAVRTDDAFEQLAEYLPKEAAHVLYGVAMGMNLDQALKEMLGVTDTGSVKPAGPGDFSHLADITNMDLVLVEGEDHLKEILSEDIEEWRIFLHPYQRRLVRWETTKPMKIFGSAGTGKTVALMHRAVWLARGLENENEKILVTTFTTNLSVTIRALIEQLSPGHHSRIEVTNLHQLARTICYRCGWRGRIAEQDDLDTIWHLILNLPEHRDIGFDPDFIQSEFDLVIDRMGIDSEETYLTTIRSGRPRLGRRQRKVLWRVFTDFYREMTRRNLITFEGIVHQARLAVEQKKFEKYRHVLVDELQDFGLEALRLIAAISPIREGLSNPLCVVGDGHQRIYNPVPVPLSRAGIDVRGHSRRLKINYRTSEQIRRYAHGLLHGIKVDDLDGNVAETTGDRSIFKGPEPQLVNCGDAAEAGRAVLEWVNGLNGAGIATHEICVTPGMDTIINTLESSGFATLELKPRQKDPGKEEQGIRYGTKKRIKGLEFRAIALIPDDDGATDLENIQRFANYVAATRAREHLLVIRMKQ